MVHGPAKSSCCTKPISALGFDWLGIIQRALSDSALLYPKIKTAYQTHAKYDLNYHNNSTAIFPGIGTCPSFRGELLDPLPADEEMPERGTSPMGAHSGLRLFKTKKPRLESLTIQGGSLNSAVLVGHTMTGYCSSCQEGISSVGYSSTAHTEPASITTR